VRSQKDKERRTGEEVGQEVAESGLLGKARISRVSGNKKPLGGGGKRTENEVDMEGSPGKTEEHREVRRRRVNGKLHSVASKGGK